MAIFVRHVLDNLLTFLFRKIAVNVGHAHPSRGQKPLKHQIIRDRIHLGNPQAERHEAPGGRPPSRPHGDLMGLSVPYKIADDEEIIGKSHLVDGLQLIVQPLAIEDLIQFFPLLQHPFQVGLKPRNRLLFQIGGVVLPFRQFIGGEMVSLKGEIHLAHLSYLESILQGLGHIGKFPCHLLRGFHIKFVGLKSHATFILKRFPRLKTEQNLMGLGILSFQVMAIVCCHEWNILLPSQILYRIVHKLLLRDPVLLNLQIEMPFTKQVAVKADPFSGLIQVLREYQGGDFPFQAGGKGNQPLMVRQEQLMIDPRFIIKSLHVSQRDQPRKILIACIIFGQENQVVGGVPPGIRLLLEPALRSHINLAPDDGMNPISLGLPVKVIRAEHIPVIRQGDGVHPIGRKLFKKLGKSNSPIEEAVLTVKMEMNEISLYLHPVTPILWCWGVSN